MFLQVQSKILTEKKHNVKHNTISWFRSRLLVVQCVSVDKSLSPLMQGKLFGKIGFFPEAFVEIVPI